MRKQARQIRDDFRLLESAIDQWAIETGKMDDDLPTWNDLKLYLAKDSRLRVNDCKDVFGNRFRIGTVGEGAGVHPGTAERLSPIIDPAVLFCHESNWDPEPPLLILAARVGDTLRVQQLLDSGTDIDDSDSGGRTALYWAAQLGHTEIVKILCARYDNPLDAINEGLEHAPGNTPLLQALNHAPVLRIFLDYGAKVNSDCLTYALKDVDVLKLLLAKGVSPNARDSIGEPILQFAAAFYPKSVRVLIDAGADVNAKWRGETALQKAKKWRQPEIEQMLIEAGAKE